MNKDESSETNLNVEASLENRAPSGKVHNPEFSSFGIINSTKRPMSSKRPSDMRIKKRVGEP